VLEVEGLVAGYGAFIVLHGMSLSVAAGEIVAVLGANGVGKTTLNRTLSGLIRARSGRIVFEGRDITASDHSAIVRAGLIHVPEGRKIFPTLTVRENLLLGSYARGKAERGETLERVLDIFPRLRERLSQAVGSMSGGEQQMVAIGRALMTTPRLILLDEPSLGLSPKFVTLIFEKLVEMRGAGYTLMLVEQNATRALAIADRGYVLELGRNRFEGPGRQLLADPEVKRLYLGG
jgi:branched-chain amino acid transport system ATP-binding protein